MNFTDGSVSYTIYEPECDSWDGHLLVARSAVAVQPAGQPEPTYGVVSFNAITLVDKTARSASLANFKLVSADFPSARSQAGTYLVPIIINYAKHAPSVGLDRLESSLAVAQPPEPEQLNNAPPKIIIATRPAVMVYIDGPPIWRPVPDTTLERAINTRILLLKDQAGVNYVHVYDGYLEAPSFDGPWKVASQPPPGTAAAEKLAVDSGQVDLMSGTPDPVTHATPSLRSEPVPDIFVETAPSELIQFGGPPQFASIPGTDLLYAANTSGNVFKLLTDQQTYILISGRWYRSASLDGPWQYVPGNELPRDFANIPDTSPKENVKASVPGTPQAEEALIANSIPQSTAVPVTSKMPSPQLDGAPQLAPIEGTPLQYVANSATPIIEVNPQSWYACQDGVWYDAGSASGPWTVATAVPQVIYTIPPTSPLHYLTYVQVYGSSSGDVYEGYTPGYLGTEVGDDGTVVYGTGYNYTPWIGTVWIAAPITWGWGYNPCWNPWWGWGYGCGFGWGWGWGWGYGGYGCYPPRPWWGGYHGWYGHGYAGGWWHQGHYSNFANTGTDVYHHYGGSAGGQGGYYANHYGQSYNSRTGWLAAGQRGQIQSVDGSAWQRGHQSGFFHGTTTGTSYGYHPANSRDWSVYSPSTSRSVPATSATHGWTASQPTWSNPARSESLLLFPAL